MSDPDEIRNVGTDIVKLNGSTVNREDDKGDRDGGDQPEGEKKRKKEKKGWDELSDIASEEDEDRLTEDESPKQKKKEKRKVSIKEEPEDIEEDGDEDEEECEDEEKGNLDEGNGKEDLDDGAKVDESQSTAPKAFFGKFIRALSGRGKKNNGGEHTSGSGEKDLGFPCIKRYPRSKARGPNILRQFNHPAPV